MVCWKITPFSSFSSMIFPFKLPCLITPLFMFPPSIHWPLFFEYNWFETHIFWIYIYIWMINHIFSWLNHPSSPYGILPENPPFSAGPAEGHRPAGPAVTWVPAVDPRSCRPSKPPGRPRPRKACGNATATPRHDGTVEPWRWRFCGDGLYGFMSWLS